MIRIALAAAACLLHAGPAMAGPVIGFIQGVVAGLSGTALIGGTIGTVGFLGGVAASTYIGGTLLGRIVLQLGVNAITAAIFRPKFPTPQDQLVNLSQPLSPMQRMYGRVRKGGPVGFTGFIERARHYVVLIAAHRTKGPVAHWLDTTEVEIDGSGNILTHPMTDYGTLRTYRGLSGQTVDPVLAAAFPEVTASYDFAGLSYAAIKAKKPDPSRLTLVYPNGREWTYAPVWDGWDEIYDPRTDTYGWTDNAALIIAHEALFHGKTVDWDQVAIEADVADEIVANGTGGEQRRWTINVALDDTVPWEQSRDLLGRACDAFFYETVDGLVGFRVGRYIEPEIVLTDRDFLSVTIAEKAWGPDVPGEAVIKYTEPAFDYQQGTTGAIVAEPDLPRLEDEIWAIDSHNQACRIGKRQIRKARARYALQGTVKLIGYELIGQRFVRVQLSELDFDQVFEVDALMRGGSGITFDLQATSVTADDFAFDALTEEPPRPARGEVASDDSVDAITGLSGEVVTGTGGVAQIEWSWPEQDESLTQVLGFRLATASEWQEVSAGEGQTSILATGLVDGATYEARIRNRTASGRLGEWSDIVSVVAIANTTAPAGLTAFAVSVSGGTTGATTFTAPNDPVYAATRIWRGTTATFGAAVLVRTEYGAPGLADGWNDTGLAAGNYWYWAAPINGSGIEGPLSGPATISII